MENIIQDTEVLGIGCDLIDYISKYNKNPDPGTGRNLKEAIERYNELSKKDQGILREEFKVKEEEIKSLTKYFENVDL